jgi:hypothetical protein
VETATVETVEVVETSTVELVTVVVVECIRQSKILHRRPQLPTVNCATPVSVC